MSEAWRERRRAMQEEPVTGESALPSEGGMAFDEDGLVVDLDEALGVPEARALDDVGPDERRDDHPVLERHGPAVGEMELARTLVTP